jgi:hypothetical protein
MIFNLIIGVCVFLCVRYVFKGIYDRIPLNDMIKTLLLLYLVMKLCA